MARTQTRSDESLTSRIRSRESLYTDFDLSFIANPNNGDITIKKDIDAIKQSVKNLILTNKHERPFQPLLGSRIQGMLFELASPFITLDIQDEIKMTIENHEPRVALEDVSVTVLDNHLRIIIKYRILSIGQQDQVDFYLERIK
jgi:phage baseplate assembly protein W|tara:strand:+ start:938 stop:1369 length:432 start_codon:yes stop_codon:yes gene_type:complete